MNRLFPDEAADRLRTEAVASQYAVLWQGRWIRAAFTLLAIALIAMFIPPLLAISCGAAILTLEAISLTLMRATPPKARGLRHGVVLLSIGAVQAALCMPLALVWWQDDPFAKALAVGILCMALLQQTTERAVHLPVGMVGLVGVGVVGLATNTTYWLTMDNLPGLLGTTVALVGGLGFTVIGLMMNHGLHRAAAADRAAARAADSAKGRFLAHMSHELRTPLNAILGMGHAERLRHPDRLSHERLGILIAAAEGLGTLLDDILDISSLEQGALPLRLRAVDPAAKIAADVNLFAPQIAAAGLTLTLDIARGLPQQVLLDPQRLRQCLTNLMSNAVKNTQRGGILVRTRVEGAALDQVGYSTFPPRIPLLRIEVRDSGPGVPPSLHETIFQPFHGSVGPVPGTGLGLAISRGLARRMGGDLVLLPQGSGPEFGSQPPEEPGKAGFGGQSEFHSGACFVLTLPLVLAPPDSAAATGPAPALHSPPSPLPPPLAGRRVLVVDDIATNRLVAVTYLRYLGADPVEAAGGEAALAMLRASMFDAVLLDLHMPGGLDGLETFRRLSAPGAVEGQPVVVAMTADLAGPLRQSLRAAGLNGGLSKPLSPERLEAELLQAFAARDAGC